jgi:hypothetical protein
MLVVRMNLGDGSHAGAAFNVCSWSLGISRSKMEVVSGKAGIFARSGSSF